MNNQTNTQNHHYNLEGLARAFLEISNRLGFIAKIITFITHFGGGQLISRAICTGTLHEISAPKISPLGASQWTRKANKTLKLTIQTIAKTVADIENLRASSCVNLQKSADTAHCCGHVTCTAAELLRATDSEF